MPKNIDIGGRLHSVASGNIVTGADEVFDDAKGKRQSEINAEIYNTLSYIPKDRGEYTQGERYYKENLVQYEGGTYVADPIDYDVDTNPLAYVTIPPYYNNPDVINEGWRVFARGISTDAVTNVQWDNNRKVITKTINSVTFDVVSADILKGEINPKFIYNQQNETLSIIE